MATVAEHQAAVRALLAPLASRPPVMVAVREAPGTGIRRVLAADLVSPVDHPLFDNSQMDGYAVRAADAGAGPLRVAPAIPAGHAGEPLRPGWAAPVMTGAPIPAGADSVVPIEQASPDCFQPDDGERSVVLARPEIGAYVRARGTDLPAGGLLLPAGTALGPAQWGVIAASGIEAVPVIPRVRVLVLSTGDEVRAPGEALAAGQLYDANSTTMALALADAGALVTRSATVHDDADAMRALLADAAPSVDLVLTTGGVSAGAYEVVREVFEPAGVRFGSVAMQPGGPQGLGVATLDDAAGEPFDVPVVAFPGNPVSALVSFELFLRPVLRALHGLPPDRPRLEAPLAAPVDSPAAKHQVRRGRLDARGAVELVGGPSSHLLHGYATSTRLVHLPVGVSRLEAGDPVETWRIDD